MEATKLAQAAVHKLGIVGLARDVESDSSFVAHAQVLCVAVGGTEFGVGSFVEVHWLLL